MPAHGKCFGVFGDPVAHSRSPVMHNAAFEVLGLPHRYHGFHVTPDRLGEALAGVRALGFGGVNLTVPHKRAAIPHLDEVAAQAWRIRAVNTVVVDGDRLVGHNTDAPGFIAALRELGVERPKRATVLGAGGAGNAVADALLHALDDVVVRWVCRDPSTLPTHARLEPTGYDALQGGVPATDLLVNATTVGMVGGPASFPVDLDLGALDAGTAVVDLVYPRPRDGLLDRAEARGLPVQDGLALLLWQGVRALELWLGRSIDEDVVAAMRAALRASDA